VSADCDSVDRWLDAGRILAWRAGLVQYRAAALRLAREMPWKLAARCFDAPGNVTESERSRWLDRMEADRWFAPGVPEADGASRPLRIVRTTGGFRGFGGPCLQPPTVTANADGLLVADGDAAWMLRGPARRAEPRNRPAWARHLGRRR